ncbi:hypothetical protein H9K57_24480 (plasmid) [Vibrio parahaemolyticus]|uniref:hypothetical protein n=1 Tax=Vibrio parahaemolyticus TaxID=670 RepID=UPI002065C89E|nr:hypothetical protein [Vibrio parahaemolyticus]UPR42116.1 hypothetical protein H9K57_24480 [Vibrio parahaemolyticus]
MKRTLSALTLCSVLVSFDSSALFCVNCASFTQMMTSNLNQAQSYVEEVQQTLNSVKNVQYQIQNLKKLAEHGMGRHSISAAQSQHHCVARSVNIFCDGQHESAI